MSDSDLLTKGDLIKSRWRITHKIGGGGFGQIFQAYDKLRRELVAVKVESNSQPRQGIRMEVTVLRRIQNRKHVCELLSGGISTLYNYMVMTLLGSSLSELRRNLREQCFTLSTTLRISLQILEAIESVHSIGFLHRDIKPSNFAIGKDNVRQIFILDFGLARKYTDYDQHVRPARPEAGFRGMSVQCETRRLSFIPGTIRYASINAHNNRELGRHDDLWSFFYMLIEFLIGSLPWSKIKDKESVGHLKETYDYTRFLSNLPAEFDKFLEHINELNYEDKPDYEFLRSLFISSIQRLGYHDDDLYDWEKSVEQDESDSLIKIEQKPMASQGDERKITQERHLSQSPTPNQNDRIHPVEPIAQSKQLKNTPHLIKSSSRTGLLRKRTESNHKFPSVQQSPFVVSDRQRSPFEIDRTKLDSIDANNQQALLHEKIPSQPDHRSPDTLTRRSTHLNIVDRGQATSNGLLTYISQQFSNAAAPGAVSVFSQWSPHNGEPLTDDDILKGNKSTSSRADERATTLSGEQTSPAKIQFNPNSSIKNNSAGRTSHSPTVTRTSAHVVDEEDYLSRKPQRSTEQTIQVPFGPYSKNPRRKNHHNQRSTPPAFSLQRFTRKKSDCS